MTIELIEYKCPACGHLVGEEEYAKVRSDFNKLIQQKSEEQIDELKGKHMQELYEKDKQHKVELQEQEKNITINSKLKYRSNFNYS
jgi:hypothetical protein